MTSPAIWRKDAGRITAMDNGSNDMTTTQGDVRLTRQQVVEDNWVDRYLLGHLTESESMAFEDFYASCPETMSELESSALLIDGLKASANADDIAGATSLSAARAAKQAQASATNATPSRWYGMAASFMAGAALLFAGGQMMGGPQANPDTMAAYVNIPVVTLGPSRGNDSGISINGTEAPQIVMQLDVGFDPAPRYSASLQNVDGKLVWQSDLQTPNSSQFLTMTLQGGMLDAGAYQMVVRPVEGAGSALLYNFTVD